MTICERLLQAIREEDYQAAADCFESSRYTEYVDYCPAVVKKNVVQLCGSNSIEMYFRNCFYPMNQSFHIDVVRILDERSGDFFACYQGRYVYARLEVEATSEKGLITKVVLRPV